MSQETCGPDLVEDSGLVPFWLKGPDINSHHRGACPTEWWSGQESLPGIGTLVSSWCFSVSGPPPSCWASSSVGAVAAPAKGKLPQQWRRPLRRGKTPRDVTVYERGAG